MPIYAFGGTTGQITSPPLDRPPRWTGPRWTGGRWTDRRPLRIVEVASEAILFGSTRPIYAVRIAALCAALLLAVACVDALAPDTVINRVTLTPVTSTLTVGSTLQLIATARNRASTPIADVPFVFSSDQPAVATVSTSGLITAVGTGAATLHAVTGEFTATVTVTVQFAVCANSGVTATITIGQTINGALSTADCAISPISNADGYRFVTTAPTTLLFTLTGPTIKPKLSLTANTLAMVVTENWSEVVGDTVRLIATVPSGTYHLWILSAFNQLGAYTLTSAPTLECTSASAATPIAVAQTAAGALTNSSCLLPNAAEGAGYTFTLTEPTAVRFDVKTVGFEPALVVTNAALDVISTSNPFGPDSAVLRDILDAGIYYAWITSERGGQGTYSLKRDTTSFTFCDAALDTISIPGVINSALTQESCILNPGFYSEPIFLNVPSTATLRIDLISTDFDAFLGIADSTDSIVLTDDDSGGDFNSRLQLTFPKGRYTILPMSFYRNEIGAYTISVSMVAGIMSPNIVPNPMPKTRARPWTTHHALSPHD